MATELKLKDRAENYTFEGIESLNVLNKTLQSSIDTYITSKYKHPIVLTGPKGIGKTFNVMRKLNEYIKKDESFTPALFNYSTGHGMWLVHPKRVASLDQWGNRQRIFESEDYRDIMERCNFIVVDNIHYFCEDVVAGKRNSSELVSFLEDTLDHIHRDKKSILISENKFRYYADKVMDEKFYRLLPRLGERDPLDESPLPTNIDYLVELEAFPLSFSNWKGLFDNYTIDQTSMYVIYNLSPSPRFAVRMMNLMGGEITYDKLQKKTLEILPYVKKSDIIVQKRSSTKEIIKSFPPMIPAWIGLDNLINIENSLGKDKIDFRHMDKTLRRVDTSLRDVAEKLLDMEMSRRTAQYFRTPGISILPEYNKFLWREDSRYAFEVALGFFDDIEINHRQNEEWKSQPMDERWELNRILGRGDAYNHFQKRLESRCQGSKELQDANVLARVYLENRDISEHKFFGYAEMKKFSNSATRMNETKIHKNYVWASEGFYVLNQPFRSVFRNLLYQA